MTGGTPMYRLIHRKFIKPKTVPMSSGVVLDSTDCPELLDPVKQKLYCSMVARVQSAAYWTLFDISYTTSAGLSHWAALTHLIGYLIHRPRPPSLKIKYWKGVGGGLDGFTDSDWENSASRKSTTVLVAQYNRTPILAIKNAENGGTVLGRGGVLFGI